MENELTMNTKTSSSKKQLFLSERHINSLWSRVQETAIFLLVGWIPKLPGSLLRQLIYRPIMKRMGRSVYIEFGVEFFGAEHINMGNEVKILRDVRLTARGQNSQILLGDRVCIERGVNISVVPTEGNCHIEVGERTVIGAYSCIAGPGNIKIGKCCLIASHVGIYANNHIFADPSRYIWDQGVTRKGIVIEDDCWLGNGVTVLDGVTIGQGSIIGAGAVVTKNVPPYSIAVGVPAKVVTRRGEQKLLARS